MFDVFLGKTHIWSQKEKPRARKIQICFGLQNQGAQKANRTPRKWHQSNERTNTRGRWLVLKNILFWSCKVLFPKISACIHNGSKCQEKSWIF